MAESELFDALAGVQKEVADALDELVSVTLIQRRDTDAPDPVTGIRAGREVPLRVRRTGIAGVAIGSDRTDPESRWVLTVYDRVEVTERDSFRWGGREHKVIRVRGTARSSDTDERYVARVECN